MPVSDEELRASLAVALGRPVARLTRRPWRDASTAPVEELEVDGCPPLLFKDLTPRATAPRPAFLSDPLREVEAYTSLLGGLDAPACLGSVVAEDRVWLFLERVDGIPLWQAEGLAPWEAAARWLGRLHGGGVPDAQRLLRHDDAHLRRWVTRALEMAPQLADLRAPALRAVAVLGACPPVFLHGECYPSNLLVQDTAGGPRIRPVDWETAGVGPGVLDLAALTSGTWSDGARRRVVDAYRAAMPGPHPDFAPALRAARLLVALQWLGWSREWSPPAEHAHDWAGEARALAAAFGA